MPHDDDDGWADLSRELGVDVPSPPPAARRDDPTADPPAGRDEPARFADDPHPRAADDDDDEFEDEADGDAGEADAGQSGEVAADGEPGGRKKRRRRRRRRKKAGNGDPAAGPAGESAAVDADPDPEPPAGFDDAYAEPADVPAGVGPGDDPARDVIATWNVPSWPDIVAGLYRPQDR